MVTWLPKLHWREPGRPGSPGQGRNTRRGPWESRTIRRGEDMGGRRIPAGRNRSALTYKTDDWQSSCYQGPSEHQDCHHCKPDDEMILSRRHNLLLSHVMSKQNSTFPHTKSNKSPPKNGALHSVQELDEAP